ncbi:MAG: hypothetical protein R3B47_20845 [Bacteroidia bacterium]
MGIGSLAEPDTLYRFFEADEKKAAERLLGQLAFGPKLPPLAA